MALITYLTTIRFGFGELAGLKDDLSDLAVRRPLIVADEGVVRAGLVERVVGSAAQLRPAPVFQDTPPNPTEEAVDAALAIYREEGCDSVVAAIIAVPTTAGTGSEVGRAALLTLRDGRKLGFISPYLIPKRAVCDPDLTLGLPAGLTAATGMDAVTHCIETYLSPRENPPAEAIALDGLSRAVAHLERAVADGGDREARREMMMAALEGGLTFQKGLGAVHSLSHALGGLRDLRLHHGTLNAILLPAVLRFNRPAAERKYEALARSVGLSEGEDLAGFIEGLNARLALPRSLSEVGLPPQVIPAMAAMALKDHSTATNPRPLTEADFAQLLSEAF